MRFWPEPNPNGFGLNFNTPEVPYSPHGTTFGLSRGAVLNNKHDQYNNITQACDNQQKRKVGKFS